MQTSSAQSGRPSGGARHTAGPRLRAGIALLRAALLLALTAPAAALGGEGTITTPSGEAVVVRHMILGGSDFYEYIDGSGRRIKHGRYKYSYRNGVLIAYIEYRHGMRHGKFIRRSDRDVTLVEGEYRNGQLHGRVLRYYPDGGLQVDAQYRDGELHGAFVRYYGSGRVQERGSFEAGRREGVFTEYHENGEPALVATYRAGVMEGPLALHTESGALAASGVLSDERIVREWMCYAEGAPAPVRVRTDCAGKRYWACLCP